MGSACCYEFWAFVGAWVVECCIRRRALHSLWMAGFIVGVDSWCVYSLLEALHGVY
jgi:hypothetical protein